jgi:hypothetical protein
MQAVVSKAFQTPEVIRMFANKNHDQLRVKLSNLQRDLTLGKISGIYLERIGILTSQKRI